jgi:hypothetical protein
MIDNFGLAISHGLIMIAAWRLLWRPDLDDDHAPSTPDAPRWLRRKDREGA